MVCNRCVELGLDGVGHNKATHLKYFTSDGTARARPLSAAEWRAFKQRNPRVVAAPRNTPAQRTARSKRRTAPLPAGARVRGPQLRGLSACPREHRFQLGNRVRSGLHSWTPAHGAAHWDARTAVGKVLLTQDDAVEAMLGNHMRTTAAATLRKAQTMSGYRLTSLLECFHAVFGSIAIHLEGMMSSHLRVKHLPPASQEEVCCWLAVFMLRLVHTAPYAEVAALYPRELQCMPQARFNQMRWCLRIVRPGVHPTLHPHHSACPALRC